MDWFQRVKNKLEEKNMSRQRKSQNKKGCTLCRLEDVGNWKDHVNGRRHLYNLDLEIRKERERNGIYIPGIPRSVDINALETTLRTYGTITDFFYHMTKNFALVSFKEREQADAVLSGHVILGNQRLVVKRRKQTLCDVKPGGTSVDVPKTNGVSDIHVQKTLSSGGSLEDFLHELEVPQEEREKYNQLLIELEKLMLIRFRACRAHVFGSMRTGLCMKGSDIDVFLEIENARASLGDISDMPLPEKLVRIGQRLMMQRSATFMNVRAIARAKTPIIKFIHAPTGLSCDVSFKNSLGVANSELIKYYITLDQRIYPYFMIIKYWAHKHDFSGCGKITNYALVTLAAFYLQQLDQPMLPTVHQLQETCEEKRYVDGWLCSFSKDKKIVEPSKNTSSIFELLTGFFNYYDKLKNADIVICPYLGKVVPKVYFLNTERLPEPLKTIYCEKTSNGKGLNLISDLCVQDPFELSHNITACAVTGALSLFQAYTQLAAKICCELLDADTAEKLAILSKLFTVETKVADETAKSKLSGSELTLMLPACWCLSLSLFADLGKRPISDDTSVTRTWIDLIHSLVIEIFTRIMRFEVSWLDSQQPSVSKVLKKKSPSDVHNPAHKPNAPKCIVNVTGYYGMWESRKVTQKSLDVVPSSHCLDIEAAVSEALFKLQAASGPPKEPLVKFTCEFIDCEDKSPSVTLVFKDIGSHKVAFARAMEWCGARIPGLIGKYFKYIKQKSRQAYSVHDTNKKEHDSEQTE